MYNLLCEFITNKNQVLSRCILNYIPKECVSFECYAIKCFHTRGLSEGELRFYKGDCDCFPIFVNISEPNYVSSEIKNSLFENLNFNTNIWCIEEAIKSTCYNINQYNKNFRIYDLYIPSVYYCINGVIIVVLLVIDRESYEEFMSKQYFILIGNIKIYPFMENLFKEIFNILKKDIIYDTPVKLEKTNIETRIELDAVGLYIRQFKSSKQRFIDIFVFS